MGGLRDPNFYYFLKDNIFGQINYFKILYFRIGFGFLLNILIITDILLPEIFCFLDPKYLSQNFNIAAKI